MRYYTWIVQDTCIACGVCGACAPEVFDYDDEGIAYGYHDNNRGNTPIANDMIEEVQDAEESCPTGSVQISKKPKPDDKS
ncbi:ferredoxin [Gracilibacillus halophilus YIM-C55.5]|uniref:Ferredoxin n=1 Tax=Gracilibacillus halophilus YIM-C55.5 TaxID=1308866 RepID=N4WAP3_9BACI|nr:ferredoxin [Gracilibacillus halophilus]ENH97368.1 ferredoxin [Gracilibacillus halophilus YIM-C55.5]